MASKEINIKTNPGYIIYFDSVRVDQFVENFSVSLSNTGDYGQASINMRYVPDFYKINHYNNSNSLIRYSITKYDNQTESLFFIDDGVENMTTVRIFMRNVFTQNYAQVFEGNIRAKSLSYSGGQYTLNFVAYDYMNTLNRILCPWSLSFSQNAGAINPQLIWTAHGVDVPKLIENQTTVNQQEARGETLQESIKRAIETTIKYNAFLSSTDSVFAWDKVLARIVLMGDISDRLRENSIVKYQVDINASHVDSFYVKLQQILDALLFEFFQDRDGLIRVKPYFWNREVLSNFIIDSSLIYNLTDSVNWNNYYTRVITTGGAYNASLTQAAASSAAQQNYLTPVAVATFAGNIISQDVMPNPETIITELIQRVLNQSGVTVNPTTGAASSTASQAATAAIEAVQGALEAGKVSSENAAAAASGSGIASQSNPNNPVGNAGVSNSAYGIPYDNRMVMTSVYGPRWGSFHKGIDLVAIGGNKNIHAIANGVVTVGWDADGYGNYISQKDPTYGNTIIYGHMSRVIASSGMNVRKGDIIGVEGSTGWSTGSHLHLEIRDPNGNHFDPRGIIGLAQLLVNEDDQFDPQSQKVGAYIFNNQLGTLSEPVFSYDIEKANSLLLKQNELEKRYGPLIHNQEQLLIDFNNPDASNPNASANSTPQEKQEAAFEALCQYSKFTLSRLNAMSNTASVTTVAMPWLRPGQNCWLDPAGIDKIFYINTISHQGSPEGCTTTTGLTMGRASELFLNGNLTIGGYIHETSQARDLDATTVPVSDDIFINKIILGPSTFSSNQAIKANVDYKVMRERFKNLHKSAGVEPEKIITGAVSMPLLSEIYHSPFTVNQITIQQSDLFKEEGNYNVPVFDSEYTPDIIKKELDNYYASAPKVIKSRSERLKNIALNSYQYAKYLYSE